MKHRIGTLGGCVALALVACINLGACDWPVSQSVASVRPSAGALSHGTERLAVLMENRSWASACAEKDNVHIAMSDADVRSFHIEVAHPVYAMTTAAVPGRFEPDWTACEWTGDPEHTSRQEPGRFVLYEDAEMELVAHRETVWWRPATVSVRVGDRAASGMHVLQLWLKGPLQKEQVLVVYPQDGYFRARPFAGPRLTDTPFGSSFLVGPISYAHDRPLVELTELEFLPSTRTFRLSFKSGGAATMRIEHVDQDHERLAVEFTQPIAGRPFAMLLSMYVTEFNNDVARLAVREPSANAWREENVLKFQDAKATDIWMGRLIPSRHNTLSPDFVFKDFSATSQPRRVSSVAARTTAAASP